MSLFEMYEPHGEYLLAVTLRPENFDALADELSRWDNGKYLVSKIIRWGEPYALTLIPHREDSDAAPMTCNLYEMFVHKHGKPLEVMNRGDLRHDWRLVAADPYR